MNTNLDISVKPTKTKLSYTAIVICFIYLYSLFALDRIKNMFSLKVDGISTTNEILIILLLIFVISFRKKDKFLIKNDIFNIFILMLYFIVIIIGGFRIESFQQWFYAGLLFLTPILMYISLPLLNSRDINYLMKFFVCISLLYCVFAIILSTNYAFFMKIVGNPIDNYRYYYQYRPSMMLGSSITVSYYFNLTLPVSFYLFYTTKVRKWKIISLISILTNIFATIILLSRLSAISMVVIVLIYFNFIKSKGNNFNKKIFFVFLSIVLLIFLAKNYDISRLLIKINLQDDSIYSRSNASRLGLNIFFEYPIFGSGMGRYYTRVYISKFISFKNMVGLVDPHNLYVLILSELGIVGLIITFTLFINLIVTFSKINDKTFRRTVYTIIFVFLLNSIGGSQLINEISYSAIFWIYMVVFKSVALSENSINNKSKYERKFIINENTK